VLAPGRKGIKLDDWISIYTRRKEVVAHARVISSSKKEPHLKVMDSKKMSVDILA
jgi:hypothetical protein